MLLFGLIALAFLLGGANVYAFVKAKPPLLPKVVGIAAVNIVLLFAALGGGIVFLRQHRAGAGTPHKDTLTSAKKQTFAKADTTCQAASTLKSSASSQRETILFRNEINAEVRVFWLDYDGKQKPYGSIAPKSTLLMETFVSHPWLFTDHKGHCLHVFPNRERTSEVVLLK